MISTEPNTTNSVGRGTTPDDFAGISLKTAMRFHKEAMNVIRDMAQNVDEYDMTDETFEDDSIKFNNNYKMARRIETAYGLYLDDSFRDYIGALDKFVIFARRKFTTTTEDDVIARTAWEETEAGKKSVARKEKRAKKIKARLQEEIKDEAL